MVRIWRDLKARVRKRTCLLYGDNKRWGQPAGAAEVRACPAGLGLKLELKQGEDAI